MVVIVLSVTRQESFKETYFLQSAILKHCLIFVSDTIIDLPTSSPPIQELYHLQGIWFSCLCSELNVKRCLCIDNNEYTDQNQQANSTFKSAAVTSKVHLQAVIEQLQFWLKCISTNCSYYLAWWPYLRQDALHPWLIHPGNFPFSV